MFFLIFILFLFFFTLVVSGSGRHIFWAGAVGRPMNILVSLPKDQQEIFTNIIVPIILHLYTSLQEIALL